MEARQFEFNVGIIGLGYVGLPLACLFAKKYNTVGYDINPAKIKDLENLNTSDKKILSKALSQGLTLTSDIKDIKNCNIYIIAVPTPVSNDNMPDVSCVHSATKEVAGILKKGDIVIYESTVYPGLTEEVCAPMLQKISGLIYNEDFYVGFSPERINPGDTVHTIENITKVTSGSTPEAAEIIDNLYNSVLTHGTYKAPDMRTAEASKIMENCQRDVQIAFFNEFERIFDKMGIKLSEVTKAAATKWNFIPAYPGLVGGHCIAVDPYYMIAKAKEEGIAPSLLATARTVNETMSQWLANKIKTNASRRNFKPEETKLLILGFSFKPDSDDIRNTKVADLYKELCGMGFKTLIYDPIVNTEEVKKDYNITVENDINALGDEFDIVVIGTRHKIFDRLDKKAMLSKNGFVCGMEGVYNK